ncbi:MAG: HEAT repeat domain-containing protein [Gemmatimonadales bacterium]|nr:HEAT repeat domain-containing protein [Gemmatimonadales bacterium]
MSDARELATRFARTLDLFRDPTAKEEQKREFRALISLLKEEGATLTAQEGRVSVNGRTLDGGPLGALAQRLEFHAVSEIVIPPDAPLQETFELLRALADQPGSDDIATRLRASGAERISVAMQPPPLEPEPIVPQGTDGVSSVPLAGIPLLYHATPPPAAPADVPSIVQDSLSAGFSPATAATRPTGELMAELARRPDGPQVGDLLAVLGRQLETAMRQSRVAQVLDILTGVVSAEQQVSDATRRRQYSIALKRMYTKSVLEAIAQLAGAPGHRDDALAALRRAGEDGVEVLLDLLVAAPTVEERRGVFVALTGMKEGTDQLVHMLGHHQWFVVRNVAELAGELALEDAVPALAQQLDHTDERVRKAVALALAKIGSRGAAEPLRRALRDKSPEVRIQAALGVGGRRSSALAMPLVVAMEEEADENVEKELMLALGRIGSAAAVQALIKFAQPGGKLFGRKSSALRTTAVEALRLAATPAAVGTLEGLTADGDKNVRAAALAALLDLKRKPT